MKKQRKYAVEPFDTSEPKATPKQRKAWSEFCRRRADFLSSISDINNEYGTNYTHEDILRKSI